MDKWHKIANEFDKQWNFLHALGATDRKHAVVRKPKNGGSYYYNYKHTHSVILLAITGPKYECLYADLRRNGRVKSGVYGVKVKYEL